MSDVRYTFQIPGDACPGEASAPWAPSGVLVKFAPEPLQAAEVLGTRVVGISTNVGTYGMGGPGFLGLDLGGRWLVVSIWGAASWIHVNGRIIEDLFYDVNGSQTPWIHAGVDELSEQVVGQPLKSIVVDKHWFKMGVGDSLQFELEESAENRPLHGGDKTPRSLEPGDDLRRAVFLAPTNEIWI